jgi:5-methylcytosine-specific restriction protein A
VTQKATRLPKSLSLEQLRELAMSGSAKSIHANTIQVRLYNRSEAVKRYAQERAGGFCECCDNPAPFQNKNNKPYLEVHHLNRLSDGGPDSPAGVAAICPTCHRNIHNGIDGAKFNQQLTKKISVIEKNVDAKIC